MTDESQISEREREILKLVATGATNQQIAQQLHISPNTVKVHLRNIFGKLGVVSRTEATLYAVRSGLVELDSAQKSALAATAVLELPTDAPALVAELPVAPSPPVSAAEPASTAEPIGVLEPPVAPPPATADLPTAGTPPQPVALPLNRFLLIGLTGALVLVLGLSIALMRSGPTVPAVSATVDPTLAATTEPPAFETRWRDLPPLPTGLSDFALSGVTTNSGSALYVMGGATATGLNPATLRYDLAAQQWVPVAPKPTLVTDVQAVAIGQRIYVPGGQNSAGEVIADLEMYDPQLDRWFPLEPIPVARSRYALAALDGKLYLFGGWDGANYSDSAWRYNPDTDSWQPLNNMPTFIADAGAVTVDGLVYLFGGENASGPLNQSLRYNPADEGRAPWTSLAPLPEARARAGVTVAGALVFLSGGSSATADLLIFSPSSGAWDRQATPMPTLIGLRAYTLGGKIFVIGGQHNAELNDSAYEYTVTYTVVVPLN